MRKLIAVLIAILIALPLIGLAGIWYIGAWNLVFPTAAHDTVAPQLPPDLGTPAILVFSKTNGFRHRDGIAGGLQALEKLSAERGWSIYASENGAVFNQAQLSRFDAVVFLNATGDMLNADQEIAFQSWLEGGGGWLGIHAAGDGSHSGWDWYLENLVGARFTAHILGPQFQTARVITELPDTEVMRGLPASWEHEEEWYSWEQSPRRTGFTVLATVDEDSYVPVQNLPGRERDLRMGDHPVVWSNCVGTGKTLYSAMGHRAEAFEQPQHLKLLENGLSWLLDRQAACPLNLSI